MANTKTREGYTKSGKSLKAVRRYYAQKAEARRRDEPEDESRKPEESHSKKRRTPEDDKLSKRIAAELKTQQEANERRARHLGFQSQPTERSTLPIIQRELPVAQGPTFFIEQPQKSIKSIKSIKSGKSAKSDKTTQDLVISPPVHDFKPSSIGCQITCLIIAIVYLTTLIFMSIIESQRTTKLTEKEKIHSSFGSITWLGVGSCLVIVAVPCWLLFRDYFIYALVSTLLMVTSLLNLGIYIIVSILLDNSDQSTDRTYLHPKNPLNFWLPITFMLYHLIALSLMIKHLIGSVTQKVTNQQNKSINTDQDRLNHDRMSIYLAP